MTTYSAEQVAAISDADARRILTGPGIPDCPNVGFFAAETLAPVGKDPSVTQIGAFGKPEAPVGIDATGAVVNFSPWSDTGSSVVNTSVRAFVDTLAAIAEFGPLPSDYQAAEAVADRLRPVLVGIDPAALSDHDGVWYNMLDEIAAGMYGDAPA